MEGRKNLTTTVWFHRNDISTTNWITIVIYFHGEYYYVKLPTAESVYHFLKELE